MNSKLTPFPQRAFYYSPLSFLRGHETEITDSVLNQHAHSKSNGDLQCFGDGVQLWFKKLEWDSRYFNCSTFRLDYIDWDTNIENPEIQIAETILAFQSELYEKYQSYYLFSEVPSEDTIVLQAFGLAKMRLIETRITYFYNYSEKINLVQNHPVRMASEIDIPNLRQVAIHARNDFDRFHADPFFSTDTADQFIAEYVEQCVKGLTDIVLVPAVDEALPGAFVCGAVNVDSLQEIRVGRLVLVAVSEARRGWYRWLNSALMLWMQEQGMSCIVNTTQSTNRAVIHVCESMGYQYGRSAHLFATYQKTPY
ncbi:hypothetical protein [Gimesia aquarii]|uniref:TDP-fucosamine acetyltransferase n=1 Tax=Gimesia aquarii TaxID=2527964 RepID=A0A517X0C7_9PLAN|nr:hypothetical protein [Gimesia aquarii]QDU10960.1 TDP-fucosamine acetyltransferase [Gimesia aquarii]